VEQKLKSTESYWHRQKWLIVYNGLVDPRPASAIAKQTGVSVGTVHKVISQYNQLGVAALETPGKGGRYNSYLTREQEKEFLAKFFEQAAKGQIPTVTQIKIAYEQLVGHPVHIAKGRGHRAEGRREKIEGLRFQYLARVLIALATAIKQRFIAC
jgi:transposase